MIRFFKKYIEFANEWNWSDVLMKSYIQLSGYIIYKYLETEQVGAAAEKTYFLVAFYDLFSIDRFLPPEGSGGDDPGDLPAPPCQRPLHPAGSP